MALAKSHPYMDQVQGCMAVTGLTLCHLYINYTVSDSVTITMLINADYRSTILEPALDIPANTQRRHNIVEWLYFGHTEK